MPDSPFFMFNALWFKPDGGAETYQRYLEAARPLLKKYGAKLVLRAQPKAPIIGDFDADLLFFIEWPSRAVLQAFAADPAYRAIAHLREDALTKSYLVPCQPL